MEGILPTFNPQIALNVIFPRFKMLSRSVSDLKFNQIQLLLAFPSDKSISFQSLSVIVMDDVPHVWADGKGLQTLGYIEELPRTRPKLYTLTDKGKELIAAIHLKFQEICERAEHGY